jgi:hypothetical protein
MRVQEQCVRVVKAMERRFEDVERQTQFRRQFFVGWCITEIGDSPR